MNLITRARIHRLAGSVPLIAMIGCTEVPPLQSRVDHPVPRGSIRIVVSTVGVDPDPDGYGAILRTGTRNHFLGSVEIPANGAVLLPADTGAWSLQLAGLAENCGRTDSTANEFRVAGHLETTLTLRFACTRARDLAFVRGDQIYRVRSNGTGVAALTTDADGRNRDPVWSPDGTRLAFVSDRGGGWRVHLMNADGSAVRALHHPAILAAAPAWSPDGTRVAFAGEEGGSPGIFVVAVDDPVATPLRVGSLEGVPTWSPDGRSLAIAAGGRGWTLSDLVLLEADGTGSRTLATGSFSRPAWAPDGSYIATSTCDETDTWEWTCSLRLVRPDGVLFSARLVQSGAIQASAWSPDSRTLAVDAHLSGVSIHYYHVDRGQTGVIVEDGHSPSWRQQP